MIAQDKGIKCKINIPDCVLFRFGQLSAWWSTNKDGYVQRHSSQSTTFEAIRRRMLSISQEDEANYSKFCCISRHGEECADHASGWECIDLLTCRTHQATADLCF